MELLVEILIKSGGTSGDGGVIDINTKDMDDFGIPLTFNISDIKDFASRKASFSKTIKVLGSPNNNKIFNYLYEIKGDNFKFNMTAKHDCSLMVNRNSVLDGYLSLKKIEKLKIGETYQIVYHVVIFDQAKNFFEDIAGKKLQDLDFSTGFTYNGITYNQGDHTFNEERIYYALGHDYEDVYTYGLVDYGYYTEFSPFPYNDMVSANLLYPHVYLKPVVDKIFSDAGYSYESSFLDGDTYSALFKQTILLHHRSNEYMNLHVCEYTSDGGIMNFISPATYTKIELGQNTCIMNGLWTTYYELGSYNYYSYLTDTGPRADYEGPYDLKFRIDFSDNRTGEFTPFVGSSYYSLGDADDTFYRISRYNANDGSIDIIINKSNDDVRTELGLANTVWNYYYELTLTGVSAERSDFFFLEIITGQDSVEELNDNPPPTYIRNYGNINISINGTSLELIHLRETGSTQDIYINNILPDMSQADLLQNIIKMFNLYIYADKIDPTKLYIEPRDDFYKGDDSLIDWTDKVDYNKNITVETLNNMIANNINLKYILGEDYYSQTYFNEYIETYGDKIINLNNPYLKENRDIQLDFQSYMMDDRNTGPGKFRLPILYEEDNILHTIYDDRIEFEPMVGFKESSGGNIRCGNFEVGALRNASYGNPRFMTHAKVFGGYSFDLNYETGSGYTFSFTGFDPYRGLYNIFWENYINDLIDDASRMVTLYCDLKVADIINLDFKKRILIDGTIYYLQKVEYDPSTISSSKVVLMKEIDPIEEGSFETFYLLKNDSGDYIIQNDISGGPTDKIIIN